VCSRFWAHFGRICRVGREPYMPYMTVSLVISLPKTLYIHRKYMVLANPTHLISGAFWVHRRNAAPGDT